MVVSRPALIGSACGAIVFALCASAACGEGAHKPLPPWTAPLDPTDEAMDPAPTSTDAHPEQLSIVTGHNSDYYWAHCRGWIHGSVDQVWSAMKDPNVIVDRRTVSSWTVTKQDVDPTAAVSFILHNVIVNVITVQIDTEWREGVTEGSSSAPTKVAVRNTLVNGNLLVTTIDDSIETSRVDDQTVEVQIERHAQNASPTPDSDIRRYEQDLFNSIVARVHGQPLPTY
jgi:hypothetical protein